MHVLHSDLHPDFLATHTGLLRNLDGALAGLQVLARKHPVAQQLALLLSTTTDIG